MNESEKETLAKEEGEGEFYMKSGSDLCTIHMCELRSGVGDVIGF